MRLYIDNVAKLTVNAASLNSLQSLPNGSHYVVINAWSNKGSVYVGKETIIVGSAPAPVSVALHPVPHRS